MPPPSPFTLIAELSYQCPLHCPYCSNPVDIGAEHHRHELATEDWIRTFRQARGLGVLQLALTGGEPMLRRDLVELCAAARDAGLYSSLITAGTLFTPERAEALKAAGLDHVQISIQSPNAEDNDRIAGNRSFDKKIAAARLARELDFPLTINCVLHRQNLDRIEELLELTLELGAQRLELANTQYYGWAVLNQEALLPTWEQLRRGEEAVQRFRERVGPRVDVLWVLPDLYEELPKPCMGGWGRTAMVVAPNGDVLPCQAASTIPGPDVRQRPRASAGLDLERVRRVRALPRDGLDAGAVPVVSARPPGGGLGRLPLPGAAADGRRGGHRSRLPVLAPSRAGRLGARVSADRRVRLPHDEAPGAGLDAAPIPDYRQTVLMAQAPYIRGPGGLSVPSADRSELLMFPRLATYSQIVAKLQWDPAAIDLAPDARTWPELPDERRRRLTTLLAGFCVAEDAVAEHLTPFADAAEHLDTMMMWIFFLQRRDEDRHALFFDRVGAEVLGLPGDTPAQRRAAARAHAPEALLELFEVRLPAIAAELAAGRAGILDGVRLYHMVLEGAVFSAGQRALLDDVADGALPGIREGVTHVELDERWHVGFGVRCLTEAQEADLLLDDLLARATDAAAAWGDAVPAAAREQAVTHVPAAAGGRRAGRGAARGLVALSTSRAQPREGSVRVHTGDPRPLMECWMRSTSGLRARQAGATAGDPRRHRPRMGRWHAVPNGRDSSLRGRRTAHRGELRAPARHDSVCDHQGLRQRGRRDDERAEPGGAVRGLVHGPSPRLTNSAHVETTIAAAT